MAEKKSVLDTEEFRSHKEIRQDEAIERQKACDKLSPRARLIALDYRLGPGVGAVKEREVLNKLIEGEDNE